MEALPDYVVACVGGGSNAIGIFTAFIDDEEVQLIGVEPGGKGIDTAHHGAVLEKGVPGCIHGMKSRVMQAPTVRYWRRIPIAPPVSIIPRLVQSTPFSKSSGRATYVSATDEEALAAYNELCRMEVLIPALESSHAPGPQKN